MSQYADKYANNKKHSLPSSIHPHLPALQVANKLAATPADKCARIEEYTLI